MSGVLVRLYQNHGKSIGFWEGWVEPSGVVVVRYSKKLDGKPIEKRYQAKSKNVGKSNETTPYDQGVLELQSKARLKLDKGYVETLDEANNPSTNTLGLEKPMLATPIEKVEEKSIDWSEAYTQPKLDGHRALFKNGVLYSRQGKVLDIPHIVEAITQANMEALHTDGELYIHGKTLQEMSKLIKKHRPESLDIEYHIYDLVEDSTPFKDRVEKLFNALDSWTQNFPLKPVLTLRVKSLDELMEHHTRNRSEGFEGTMLRFGNEGYKDGKRSRSLLKVKDFQDAEFKVVDVKEGKPYLTNLSTYRVPVWVCVTENGEYFDVTAHGDMHEKDAQWKQRSSYIGKKLTVKFHYYSEKGIPQLPIALRFYEEV